MDAQYPNRRSGMFQTPRSSSFPVEGRYDDGCGESNPWRAQIGFLLAPPKTELQPWRHRESIGIAPIKIQQFHLRNEPIIVP